MQAAGSPRLSNHFTADLLPPRRQLVSAGLLDLAATGPARRKCQHSKPAGVGSGGMPESADPPLQTVVAHSTSLRAKLRVAGAASWLQRHGVPFVDRVAQSEPDAGLVVAVNSEDARQARKQAGRRLVDSYDCTRSATPGAIWRQTCAGRFCSRHDLSFDIWKRFGEVRPTSEPRGQAVSGLMAGEDELGSA